jgi:hypothetical protein
MAERYFDWAQQQVDRANRTLNPKARNDRLALAEYYFQLAEGELVAAKSLKASVGPPQIQAKVLSLIPKDTGHLTTEARSHNSQNAEH